MSAIKKIRLEQKAMPVSSEEELTLITLREQNHRLSNNHNHRLKIESDLRKKIQQLEDTLKACEDKQPEHQLTIVNESLRNRIEDLETELNRTRLNERRLIDHISSKQENSQESTSIQIIPDDLDGDRPKDDHASEEFELKLADLNSLAEHRLHELQTLNEQYKDALIIIDKLKAETKHLPKDVIIESAEYKTLQSSFSVLYNEATQLKTQLIDSKSLMMEMKNSHEHQIERMQIEEQRMQQELRDTIVDLERRLAQKENQYALFKVENEQITKQNEQTLKLDIELKKTLNSYKIQVQQKISEIARLKRLLEESRNNVINNTQVNNSPSNKVQKEKDIISQLQKQLEKTKNEEEALMQDLDVTGQAYEDMQEQNHRLLQQLEEKDDANFKLMSEHLKTNAFQKHLNEEKAGLLKQIEKLNDLLASAGREARIQHDQARLKQEYVLTLEQELGKRKLIADQCRNNINEIQQQLREVRSEKDKIYAQLEHIQKSFTERTAILTQESFKNKRLIEELESTKKKYDRAIKLQSATAPDEVLMEEIREYKEQLTCPSCKTKPKDAVLTKCFHVFCFDCLKTRVDTRQRKCPKCNAQFGANDFHRLYLV